MQKQLKKYHITALSPALKLLPFNIDIGIYPPPPPLTIINISASLLPCLVMPRGVKLSCREQVLENAGGRVHIYLYDLCNAGALEAESWETKQLNNFKWKISYA